MEQITTSDELIDFLTLPGYQPGVNHHITMEHALHMKTRTQQIEELRKSQLDRVGKAFLRTNHAGRCGEVARFVDPDARLAQLGAAEMRDTAARWIKGLI